MPPIGFETALQVVLAIGAAASWVYETTRVKAIEKTARLLSILRDYEGLQQRNDAVVNALRKRVETDLSARFLKRDSIDWEQVVTAIGLSVVGFALAWIFLFFKAGDQLSFFRILGGLFFGIGWGTLGLVGAFGKLFRLI